MKEIFRNHIEKYYLDGCESDPNERKSHRPTRLSITRLMKPSPVRIAHSRDTSLCRFKKKKLIIKTLFKCSFISNKKN